MSGPWAIDWVKSNLTAIYSATTQPSFDDAFSKFPAKDGTITLNGKSLSRDQYKQYLEKERVFSTPGTIKFLSAIEVLLGTTKTKTGEITLASVGIFYEAKVSRPVVNQSPGVVESIVASSVHVKVKRESGSVPPPAIGTWLVTSAETIDQVAIEKAEPVKK